MTNRGFANAPENSRNATAEPFTLREWFSTRRLLWHLGGLAVTILLFGYIGPFNTFAQMGLGERLLYWALAMASNWAVGIACVLVMVVRFSHRLPTIVCVLLGSLLAAIPGTGLIALIELAFDHRPPVSMSIVGFFVSVALIHLILGVIVWLTIEVPLRTGQAPVDFHARRPPASEAEPPPLLDRLPVATRGALLHLRMQDHYVEVHTDRGSELVLLRFGDALKELGGTEGMQVHRSHWIARDALRKITRRGSRTFAHLSNGAEVPVSRSYAKSLREAQWI